MYLKAVVGIIAAYAFYFIVSGVYKVINPEDSPLPILPEDVWWGARSRDQVPNDGIRPFTITTSDQGLANLRGRLENTRFPTAPFKDANFHYGFNIDYLKNVTSYWLNNYNWKSRLQFLNKFPHFKTTVSGLDIHFIHVKPKVGSRKSLKVVPILLLHGWPGSVREMYDLIPLLTTPRENQDFVFEIVAPSLPGYGYSEGAAHPGMGPAQIGVIFKKLMQKLRHEKFYIHGEDWGSMIAKEMSVLYPQQFLKVLGSLWPRLVIDKEHEHRMYPLSDSLKFLWLEFGYFHLQATKPDTIGMALLDTPVGLAAYILEKYSVGTNPAFRDLPDGGLTKKYSLDALLDNVMIYWTTESILTSVRLYSEYSSAAYYSLGLDRARVKVPTACTQFPHEITYYTPEMLRRKFTKLVKISEFDDGGHFAAFENPNLVADDLWASIPLFVKAHKEDQPVKSCSRS